VDSDEIESMELSIRLKEKVKELQDLFAQYLPHQSMLDEVNMSLDKAGLTGKDKISVSELARLHESAEKRLAGTIGAATARIAMKDNVKFTKEEAGKLSELYVQMIQGLNVNPQDLREKIDFYKERERMLEKHAIELEGSILERDEQMTKRKLAENKMRQLNIELEERVSDRTRQLETANSELESFSYSISHDLRSPLRAIDGFSKALLEDYKDKLDEEGVDFLHRVRNGSQRMGELISDILQLSRFSRSKMTIQEVNLSSLAKTIIEELSLGSENNTQIVIQENIKAECDKVLIGAVLQNLLSNACKFSSKNESARVELGCTQQQGERLYFVKDNGVGFDPQYANKLFTPFQRLHSNAEFPGSGIGLATVKRIVARHNGKVWADTIINKGATFFFTLNLKKGDDNDTENDSLS